MCSTCSKAYSGYKFNKKLTIPQIQECKYTFDQLANKLQEQIELQGKSIHISYLRSALNFYSKNCNLFNKQLDELFEN